MNAVEFTVELTGDRTLMIPREVAEELPKCGRARVILLTNGLADDALWREGGYEQFMRDDLPEDAVYDTLR